MSQFQRLLETPDSELAQTAFCLLRALIAGLDESLRRSPDRDPGRPWAERLLTDLKRELEESGSGSGSESEPGFGPAASPTADLSRTPLKTSVETGFDVGWGADAVISASPPELDAETESTDAAFAVSGLGSSVPDFRALRESARQSEAIRQEVGEPNLPSADRPEFWTEFRLLLLRLPDALAEEWAERADAAAGAGNLETSLAGCDVLPGDRDELVFPGLKQPKARGLRLSASAAADSRLKTSANETCVLARIVSTCLGMTDRDRNLKHAYYPLFPFGMASDLALYREKLAEVYAKATALDDDPGADPAKRFLARVDLDEAIHSLVFDPPAHRRSWWGQLQQRARLALDDAKRTALASGTSVHWQNLSGRYSEAIEYTDSDRDWKVDKGGTPGWVSICLRVFARIGGKAHRGRTLYRPYS